MRRADLPLDLRVVRFGQEGMVYVCICLLTCFRGLYVVSHGCMVCLFSWEFWRQDMRTVYCIYIDVAYICGITLIWLDGFIWCHLWYYVGTYTQTESSGTDASISHVHVKLTQSDFSARALIKLTRQRPSFSLVSSIFSLTTYNSMLRKDFYREN